MRKASSILIALALVLIGCSSDSKPSTTGESSGSSSAAVTSSDGPPPEGLPAFYGVPTPLPDGKPGDVIKTERADAADVHGTVLRVMYHSQSLQGGDIPVTGLIAIPSAPPPAGGYPVITWAHGTTGIADTCAPSLEANGYASLANTLLDAGYLVAGTDYEGLGTPGRHPYIVGESEARSTLDIVRAARNIPDTHASDRYAVWGHSQGGHAAMYALHIADEWAPELHLVGVVAGAPPSQLLLIYQALQASPFKHYLLMAAAGFNAAYGDEKAPLDQVLTAKGIELIGAVDHGCSGDVASALAGVQTGDLSKVDPSTVPAWNQLLVDNDPGKFTSPAKQPLLIIQGGNDEQIPVIATQLMFDQLCKINQVEQRWIYPGQSHAGVIGPSFGDMLGWINRRFAGDPTPDAVAPTGLPDVQTQSCPR
jgi:pimeloyl-ACP methyl ester carboxylesterase